MNASPRYAVLIRTFNSAATLAQTVRSLQQQEIPPSQYVFIDSGSADNCLVAAPPEAEIHRFEGAEYNYSSALNQGVRHVREDHCLVISSHTSLQQPEAMRYALNLLATDPTIGAAYFCGDGGPLSYLLIDQHNFSGFNGVWNTSGLFRSELLRARPFRHEVYSAEDQEWSSWLFKEKGMKIARISGGGMQYDNPRKYPLRKWLAEYLSVATFAKPELKSWYMIARIAYRVIKPRSILRDRYYNFVLFFRLIACRFREPRLRSKYW